jgi:hypothetical protein
VPYSLILQAVFRLGNQNKTRAIQGNASLRVAVPDMPVSLVFDDRLFILAALYFSKVSKNLSAGLTQ